MANDVVIRIVLVSDVNLLPYTPLLPGAASGSFVTGEVLTEGEAPR